MPTAISQGKYNIYFESVVIYLKKMRKRMRKREDAKPYALRGIYEKTVCFMWNILKDVGFKGKCGTIGKKESVVCFMR